MPSRNILRLALALLLLLGGYSLWSVLKGSPPSTVPPPIPSSVPSSVASSFVAPELVVPDPANRPVVAWDTEKSRVDAQLRYLIATYVESVKKQDLPGATVKSLSIQAGASLRDCLATIVDVDEAWASCTVAPTTAVIPDSIIVQDATHAIIMLRVLPKDSNAAIPGASVRATLSRDGARLEAHRLMLP